MQRKNVKKKQERLEKRREGKNKKRIFFIFFCFLKKTKTIYLFLQVEFYVFDERDVEFLVSLKEDSLSKNSTRFEVFKQLNSNIYL